MSAYELVSLLDLTCVCGPVRECLKQAQNAIELHNWTEMRALSRLALDIARECRDAPGEAAAQLCLGIAFANLGRPLKALYALEKSRRIYHRNPLWHHRRNEALAQFARGIVWHKNGSPSSAIAHWQKALGLLDDARRFYSEMRPQDMEPLDELRGLIDAAQTKCLARVAAGRGV